MTEDWVKDAIVHGAYFTVFVPGIDLEDVDRISEDIIKGVNIDDVEITHVKVTHN